jgi:hypothetical protein
MSCGLREEAARVAPAVEDARREAAFSPTSG